MKPLKNNELEFGNYSPFQYTLELSRSLNGPVEAYVNMKNFGIKGYQKLIGGLMETSEFLKDSLEQTKRFEVINREDSDGFVTLFVAKEHSEQQSFFQMNQNCSFEELENQGQYNYKFYLYLLEQQELGLCWFSLDYSSGYHILKNGKKIGVLKAYPMSPYFDKEMAGKLTRDILKFQESFDRVKNDYIPKEVPHKPRDFCFR